MIEVNCQSMVQVCVCVCVCVCYMYMYIWLKMSPDDKIIFAKDGREVKKTSAKIVCPYKNTAGSQEKGRGY